MFAGIVAHVPIDMVPSHPVDEFTYTFVSTFGDGDEFAQSGEHKRRNKTVAREIFNQILLLILLIEFSVRDVASQRFQERQFVGWAAPFGSDSCFAGSVKLEVRRDCESPGFAITLVASGEASDRMPRLETEAVDDIARALLIDGYEPGRTERTLAFGPSLRGAVEDKLQSSYVG